MTTLDDRDLPALSSHGRVQMANGAARQPVSNCDVHTHIANGSCCKYFLTRKQLATNRYGHIKVAAAFAVALCADPNLQQCLAQKFTFLFPLLT